MASGFGPARYLAAERMDDPTLPADLHRAALSGLTRLNRWSRSERIVWQPLARLLAEGRPLRVLDVATGAGDIPVALRRRAVRRRWDLRIDGCDVSEQALMYARSYAARQGAAVRFFRHDAVRDELPGDYDAIVCSLFLHHLSTDEAVSLLRRMADAARRLVVINDLRRSHVGVCLAHAATRLMSRSPIVRADGPQSARAAFTAHEATELARRAGLVGATVERRWPYRLLLQWRRP